MNINQNTSSKNTTSNLKITTSKLLEDKDFYEFLKIMSSKNRISNHFLINKYLLSLKNFKSFFSMTYPNIDLSLILNLINMNLEVEYIYSNTVLLRSNEDQIDKFYINIKGKFVILQSVKRKKYYTKKEYLSYLIKLRLYNEMGLLDLILEEQENKSIFPLSKMDFSGISPFSNENTSPYIRNNLVNDEIIENLKKEKNIISNSRRSKFTFLIDEDLYDKVYNICKDYNISNYDYKNRLNHQIVLGLSDDISEVKYYFTVYEYEEIDYFTNGMCFWSSNMMSIINKSNDRSDIITIVSKEESYIGIINNKSFQSLIEESNRKLFSQKILNLMKYPMFSSLKNSEIEKKILPFLECRKMTKGEILYKQNEEVKKIVFIRNGEFIIKYKGSIKDIERLQEKVDHIPSATTHKNSDDSNSSNKQRCISIKIVKDYGVFGLGDYDLNNKSLYEISCHSLESEVYMINRNVYDIIILHIGNKEKYDQFHKETIKKNRSYIVNNICESIYSNNERSIEKTTIKTNKHLVPSQKFSFSTKKSQSTGFVFKYKSNNNINTNKDKDKHNKNSDNNIINSGYKSETSIINKSSMNISSFSSRKPGVLLSLHPLSSSKSKYIFNISNKVKRSLPLLSSLDFISYRHVNMKEKGKERKLNINKLPFIYTIIDNTSSTKLNKREYFNTDQSEYDNMKEIKSSNDCKYNNSLKGNIIYNSKLIKSSKSSKANTLNTSNIKENLNFRSFNMETI